MKLTKLQNISADECFRLFKYLEKFAPKDSDKKQFVLAHYKNFFPELSFDQEIILSNIIDEDDHDALKDFIELNPDIQVNLDGDSKINLNKTNIEAKEKSLLLSYNYLKNLNKKLSSKEKQIVRAYELTCLKNIISDEKNYNILKMKVLKKSSLESLEKIKQYESIKDVNIKLFLSKVFKYYLETNSEYFLKYVLFYLDIIYFSDNKSELKQKYIQNILNAIA